MAFMSNTFLYQSPTQYQIPDTQHGADPSRFAEAVVILGPRQQ